MAYGIPGRAARWAAVAILLALPAASCGQATAVDVVAESARPLHRILTAAADERGFSGAVIVERAGTIVLKSGYGLADRERGIPFTARTIAQVGSLTKQFTAMAVVDLWNQGRIELTDPVSRYLPEAAPPLASRTLHQLLTHSAGLPENCGRDFQAVTIAQLLRGCLAADGAVSEPGSFSYSNVGYSLLGAVVEAVAGVDLDTHLRRRFFQPLGMERTGYRFPAPSADDFALGYTGTAPQRPIHERIATLGDAWWNLKGNGGMQASPEDMHRWSVALRRGPVITDAMRAKALDRHVMRDPGVFVAYGWFVRTDDAGGTVRISHSGSDGVFFSTALWWPETDTFLYLVGSSGEAQTLEALRALLEALPA